MMYLFKKYNSLVFNFLNILYLGVFVVVENNISFVIFVINRFFL